MATDYANGTRKGSVFNTTAATANQVAVTIPTDEIGDDTLIRLEAKITAVATDNYDEGQYYWLVGLFKRDGGTLAQIGSTASVITAIESVGGRDANFNVSGDDIQIRVSPADTTPLTWKIDTVVDVTVGYSANSGYVH